VIVGKKWLSGSDSTSLGKVEGYQEPIIQDLNHTVRFNKEGFLVDQGIGPTVESATQDISYIVEHGYVYVASKEMFLYADKLSEITDPTILLGAEVPSYIRTVFNDLEVPGTGVPSGLPYSVFNMGIPKLMTPLIVYEYPVAGPSTVIRTEKLLNEIDREDLTIPEGKNTGIEEPIAEIYEVETINKLNESEHEIINPDDYIYDPTTSNLFIQGIRGRILVQYEDSDEPRVKLGKDFSASRIGKDSGLLILSTKAKDVAEAKATRADIISQGTTLYIKQGESDSVILDISTLYKDSTGNVLDYETMENNSRYAYISLSQEEEIDIYIEHLYIGRSNESGIAIVPIIAWAGDSSHGQVIIEGRKNITLYSSPGNMYTGKVRIKLIDPSSGLTVREEDYSLLANIPNVSVGSAEERVLFVAPGTDEIELPDGVLFHLTEMQGLHQVYRREEEPITVEDFRLSFTGDENVIAVMDPPDTGNYIRYYTYPRAVVAPEGGGTYGIN